MELRRRVEAVFERWGRRVAHHPRIALLASLLVFGAFALTLPALEIDTSSDVFLNADDQIRVTFDSYRAQFGQEDIILIAVEPPEVFDLPFLERLRSLHHDLEREVPQLAEITSLVNVRYTYGAGDELIVEDLLETWPRDRAGLDRLKTRTLSNPLYENWLISSDGSITTVVIELDTWSAIGVEPGDELAGFDEAMEIATGEPPPFITGDEVRANVEAIRAVVDRHDAADFRLSLTGGPVAEITLMSAMQRDIALFVAISIFTIAALLFALFRRLSGVLLPLLVVAASLLCTVGAMALTGVPITLPIQVLPSFLLAIGVCDSVHVLVLFFRELERGSAREDAIARALGRSGLAIGMTSLTTAGGLAAFGSAELLPVVHFGIFGPLGTLFAFFFTVVMLPALLSLMPSRARSRAPIGSRQLDRVLAGCASAATRHPVAILASTAAIIVVAVAGFGRLYFFHDILAWLPERTPVRLATELVDRELGGASSLSALIRTPQENGLHEPELMQRLDRVANWAATLQRGELHVGKTVSAADVLKEIHQALNENRPEFYAIPSDRRLIAQEFLLFENAGTDDLEDVVDSQFRQASFSFRVPSRDAFQNVPFIDEIEAHMRAELAGIASVEMTGGLIVMDRVFFAMIGSMARSYVIALLIVTPLMILVLGSLRGGLLSLIPNLTPIVIVLGLMGWLGVPIDFSTMMVGPIILGVAVDDTIHFAHHFQRAYERTGDPRQAVHLAIESTGHALLFTTLALVAGFSTYLWATMGNLFNLGVFTSLAIAIALAADLLVAPALLVLFRAPRIRAAQPSGVQRVAP
jgi:predicted RND superfamily exporter protein